MADTIYAFDVSNITAAGGNLQNQLRGPTVPTIDGYKRWSMDVGGIAFVFTHIYDHMADNNVFLFDNTPTVKQDLIPDYKGNRDHSSPQRKSVFKQRKLCKLILDDIGFTTLGEEGYEADDLAYSLWHSLKGSGTQINFVVNDSDYYFMIDDYTSILPSTSRAHTVTKDNYSEHASKRIFIPYNTIVLYKILFGEPGDNIPSKFTPSDSRVLWDFYLQNFPQQSLLSDFDTLNDLFHNVSNPELQQNLLFMLEAIYPYLRPIPEYKLQNWDEAKLFEWGCALGHNKYGKYQTSNRIKEKLEQWITEGLF